MAGLLLALALAQPVDYDARFEAMRAGKWQSQETNDDGVLAWGESYVLMAYAAHGDRESLRLLAEHGERIWKNRDDRRQVTDVYRGKVVAGWGCRKYTRGRSYVWAVHTGMIVHPLAEYCRLAEGTDTARRWRKLILESVRVFDGQWRQGPGREEGHYVGLALENKALPLNQMNALGRALLSISRWKDAPAWAGERARKLLRFFRNRLTYDRAGDRYDWSYQARKGRGEDISHAAINVDFAAQAAALGIVFDARDMKRFANTFLSAEKSNADTVSGTGRSGRYAAQWPRWLALARWDRRVHDRIARRAGAEPGLLATALLARHAPACVR